MSIPIENISKEQRKDKVKIALSFSTLDNESPSNLAINIVKEYIDGKCEILEVQNRILALYKKGGEFNE